MSPPQERFYRALPNLHLPDGAPHVACLRVGGEIVATHLGVIHQRRFYWLMPGHESGKWSRYSVGRMLLQALVEWCIESGLETFDFTVGDEEYKWFWANTATRLYESRYPLTLKGAGFLAAQRAWTVVGQQLHGVKPASTILSQIKRARR